MNEIKGEMPLSLIIGYIDYKLRKNAEELAYKMFMSEHISMLVNGMRPQKKLSFIEMRKDIWDTVTKETTKKDMRTAQQIINDTFCVRNMKII